jgi:hypothetical protein
MYFPKSQITTNLYTNGGEYITLNDNQDYKGYYWKTQSGRYFTGKTPQDTPIQEIISVFDSTNATKFRANVSNNPVLNAPLDANVSSPNIIQSYAIMDYPNYKYKPLIVPSSVSNLPTENDYKLGEYRRYFCRKANEVIYIEVNKFLYEKLLKRDDDYYWQLYIPFNIPWKLIGEKEEVYKVNKNMVEFVTVKKRAYKFDVYLQKDYLKYYKEKP